VITAVQFSAPWAKRRAVLPGCHGGVVGRTCSTNSSRPPGRSTRDLGQRRVRVRDAAQHERDHAPDLWQTFRDRREGRRGPVGSARRDTCGCGELAGAGTIVAACLHPLASPRSGWRPNVVRDGTPSLGQRAERASAPRRCGGRGAVAAGVADRTGSTHAQVAPHASRPLSSRGRSARRCPRSRGGNPWAADRRFEQVCATS
jgi:hypothetical protein